MLAAHIPDCFSHQARIAELRQELTLASGRTYDALVAELRHLESRGFAA